MKNITLLVLSFFMTNLIISQVVLTEDFEGGTTFPTASGWTVQDLAVPPNGEVWVIDSTGEAGGFTTGNTLVYSESDASGNYATFDSDGYGNTGTAEESTLTSPVFDASALTSVTLTFDTIYNGNWGGQGEIDAFNGTNWVTIQTYATQPTGTPLTTVTGVQIFDVPELVGVSNAQIRFRFTGNWSISWSIDNISVFQCSVSAPEAVSALIPADGATDVAINYGDPNNLGPIEWTPSPTGDPADSFNISFGTNQAGDDIGSLIGFASGGGINFNWQPNTTYFWFIESVNCAGTTASSVFSFTTSACTDTSAPVAASAPVPNDGASNVTIDADGNALALTWTGDPDANFTLNFGTSNPPTQSFNNFNPGIVISGLSENTTYFWSIDPINCFGETIGTTVWSFTTGMALSVTENEIDNFGLYPNPTSGIIDIRGSQNIEFVKIMDLTGKIVATLNNASIIDNKIDISYLQSGLYLLEITSNRKSEIFRIVKE